ncbi:MAG: S8 family serine peptidase, partial [Oscillospiraceae bacterium]|nr:S8 family serine peptidase [Oscillospiraceae bacterium]
MKRLLSSLLIVLLLVACTNNVVPADAEPEIFAAEQTAQQTHQAIGLGLENDAQPSKSDANLLQDPSIEFDPEPSADFSTMRLIVNTDAENIKAMALDGLISVESYNGTSSLLIFRSENNAEAANEVFLEQSIFSEPDIVVSVDNPDFVYIDSFRSWGVVSTAMNEYQDYLKAQGSSSSIIVAVLDTGVDAAHPMLKGRVISGWNFVNGNSNTTDRQGHGTHVSGTIAESTLGNVSIMPVKVLNDSGSGYSSDVISGIRWAADNGAKVINLSLGGYGNLQSTRDAILYANSKGSVVVVSAGNSNDNASLYDPAWVPEAITVAAHNDKNQKASFSNYGNVIDVSGPGVSISSAVPGTGYQSKSGTSMSAPHVSAAVALLMSDANYRGLSPHAIQEKIKEVA